jgi:hypothetical protein
MRKSRQEPIELYGIVELLATSARLIFPDTIAGLPTNHGASTGAIVLILTPPEHRPTSSRRSGPRCFRFHNSIKLYLLIFAGQLL